MTDVEHELTATLWRWSVGEKGGDWFFVTVNGEIGEALSATALMHRLETGRPAGWGAVKVEANVGDTCWRTSAFPSKERGWMVPVKAAVRKAEGLIEGEPFTLTLSF
ncbi:DUF1905 domain-containing protein [Novosphingobium sp. MMS21-SN21R]|uniref:DUF1905 domain-containing protein n=1 Tax=Novosphingobium sp. MMS21-SN21R TaxID=2969298 RepID=UPI002884B45A|nr:DUF1905 domain-containing protein [Novosphingobium sp. MMS21-SN21R]MDT0507643.1 DUF1905 domain-containing protein [Novosphingobium sp. MMS21-SN21R]